MRKSFLLGLLLALAQLGFAQLAWSGSSEKTCNTRVVNCHAADEPSASSAHFIACAYDWSDGGKLFAENVKSVLKGNTETVSCKNREGWCDFYINGGNKIGDLTLSFCFGVTHVEVNNTCPSTIYVKADNNLLNFGIHTNTSGCGDFDF